MPSPRAATTAFGRSSPRGRAWRGTLRRCLVAVCFVSAGAAAAGEPVAPEWSPEFVQEVIAAARRDGDPRRGAGVFAAAESACSSCHRIAGTGGGIGPELSTVGRCLSAEEIVESLYWPQRTVKPDYRATALTLADGRVLRGILARDAADAVELVDAAGQRHRVAAADIEDRVEVGSLMPANVFTSLPPDQRLDLVRYLLELGRTPGLESVAHRPGPYDLPRTPLRPTDWPHLAHPVNRDRIYDAYARQAERYRATRPLPLLLPAFPGLDGGRFGHWGNQNDLDTWRDDRWNHTDLGSVQCCPLEVGGRVVPRAVCVRLGDDGEMAACFDPDTLSIAAVWSGGFLSFAAERHGFMAAARPAGKLLSLPPEPSRPPGPVVYRGFHRHGGRVIFAYRIGETEYLDAPWVRDGRLVREIAPAAGHPLAGLTAGGPPRWPQVLETTGVRGTTAPYAIDTIVPPFDNPWKSLMFFGGHDFFSDGSAAICTMQGDVWRVEGLDDSLARVRWRRIATGLNRALGLAIVDDIVHVIGGDQLTRLVDRNGDGEADFHECVSNRFAPAVGHDYHCGLERDAAGHFFTASHQGLLRISPADGSVEVLAKGFRNPDGLCLLPDGTVSVPVSEGEFTPASAICAVRQRAGTPPADPLPDFQGRPPELPLVYLPRGLDHSSGGQTVVTGTRWGPLEGQVVHFSFGSCTHFLVLRDEVAGRPQGAVVPLPGDFRSGVHRGRYSPRDGQLYVSGMNGWGSYAVEDGCFQRVRYTGGEVLEPCSIRAHRNGVLLGFTAPLDRDVAADPDRHFAQCWNYRYGPAYGSPEFSASHPGTVGHDPLPILSATVLADGRRLFLEIPDIQPVNQLHLNVAVRPGRTLNVFATVHALAEPFRELPQYREVTRPVAAHPILRDMAALEATVPNPWRTPIPGGRPVEITARPNLAFGPRELRAAPGEPLAVSFVNPDVVPHNWVLVKPGRLAAVGGLGDRLVADPEAWMRQYVPRTDDVVVHTDVVPPGGRQTIHFRAPDAPGRHPFLCTFPGHWGAMNGELVVVADQAAPPSAAAPADAVADRAATIFRRDNLVAWCIVPFDGAKRGPEDRAAMLAKLGFKHFAYDWRPEHVPTFTREWDALAKHGVALDAFWSSPPDLPGLLAEFRRRHLRPSFWVSIDAPADLDQEARVRHAAAQLRPLAEAVGAADCRVSIYNHGGWGGEPENMVAVCDALDLPHVGIVYNQHHGHDHLPRFERALAAMLPHLHCLNLNGMTAAGDRKGQKILVIGQGDLDVDMARIICRSGYSGPVGILNHTDHDAEARLLDNLEGLAWVVGELTGHPVPRPTPRTR